MRKHWLRFMVGVLVAFGAIGWGLNVSGCSTVNDEQNEANKAKAAQQDAQLAALREAYGREIDTLRDQLAAVTQRDLDAGTLSPERGELQKKVAEAESLAAQVEALKAELAKAREAEANPKPNQGDQEALSGLNAAIDMLPAPFGGLAKLGVGLAVGYFGGTQRGRNRLAAVVGAIDMFVKSNPVVKQQFAENADKIHAFMGEDTVKAVKKVRTKAKVKAAVLNAA